MGRKSLVAAAVAAGLLAVVAGGVLWLGPHIALPAAKRGPAIGGPFTLTDQSGRRVTERDLLGKPTLIFFGFTYCPEVCPTTLAAMTAWLKALGPQADRLNVVYVTIDPERDTPRQMAAYLTAFDPRIRGLSGTPAQIKQIASEYSVYYQKVPLAGGGYTMDHSSMIYLMDQRGAFKDLIAYQEPTDKALTKIRALLAGAP